MNRILKGLMVCITLCLILAIIKSVAIAQVGFGFPTLWDPPSFSSDPLQMPVWEDFDPQDILVDNFEYWDSPYNHGWYNLEPPYPIYGYGFCYGSSG